MTRISAAILWLLLGIAASTGCIPIIVPAVQQDITTGEKLRAIDLELKRATLQNSSGAYMEAKYQSLSAEQCKELRRLLIAGPPSMFAYVSAESGTTPENYSVFNPGLYAPEEAAVLAVAGDEPILLVERVSGTQTGGLLPHVLWVGTHATGALEAKGNIVKATTREHGLVELDEVGVRDETLAELLVEVPMLVENRDARNLGLKGGGDGHRSRSLDHRGRMVAARPRTRWLKLGNETRNYCRDIWTLAHWASLGRYRRGWRHGRSWLHIESRSAPPLAVVPHRRIATRQIWVAEVASPAVAL